ncbi:MAG: leucine-rich repeat domain-containing protein [Mycoplasmoidaceae bacterium]|nr:leucine-rich repeat domain-containing protein [Mycoplasmoidaceae bacterium]
MNLGSFAENDYVIDGIKGTITYISGISIHAYNLVIPNYVDHNGQKLKVYLGEKCFMNNSGISGTIELNDFIREIPTNCFSFCSSLTGVIFKNSPTNIADFAFCDTPLLSKIYVLKDGQLSTD